MRFYVIALFGVVAAALIFTGSSWFGKETLTTHATHSMPCADLNGNRLVTATDLAISFSYHGQTVPPAPPQVDQNGDGVINVVDHQTVASQLGAGGVACQDAPVDCAADLNRSGQVTTKDVAVAASYFGQSVPPAPPQVDFNGDGAITPSDILFVFQRVGLVTNVLPCQDTGLDCLADLNGDGQITEADLQLALPFWGQTVPPAPYQVDLRLGDRRITIHDLQFIAARIGMPIIHCQENPIGPIAGGYDLEPFATSPQFDKLMDLAVIPGTGGEEAVVITQHTGKLLRISLTGAFEPQLFGDIGGQINTGFEEGLLSIAFSPDYVSDGLVYLYYTRQQQPTCSGLGEPQDQCTSRLSRFTVTDNQLNVDSEQVLLEVNQPFHNHNGGRVLFGPDGYLYLSLGDGGSAGDPLDYGQNTNTLLGTVLRLDVSGPGGYTIPADNPFVEDPEARDEIWAYGLRNPWRFSFDRQTDDMWLGDVGQNRWEEVNHMRAGGNFGWRCYEGFEEFNTTGCPPPAELIFPRAVYPISGQPECAIIGGYVYRGAEMPELNGWFVYGDTCSGRIWAVNATVAGDPVVLMEGGPSISSFAELPNGELLVLTFTDTIYQLTRSPE